MKKNIDLVNGNIIASLTALALPIMATAFVQMAYNLTDMAWIGRVGALAVAAVGTGSMYTWLSQGIASLAKMGGQVKVAHSLGEKNEYMAAEYAQGAIQMGIVLALLFSAVIIIFGDTLIGYFRLSDAKTVKDAVIYLKITCGAIIFPFLNSIYTGIFTAMGDSRTPLRANVTGLIINMVFDPMLIHGMFGLPKLGVIGAAIATVAAQAIVLVVFLYAAGKDRIVYDKVRILGHTEISIIKTIIKIGLPASFQNLIYTSISLVLTRLAASYGDAAVAIQRLGGQVEAISWMTADGFAAAVNSFSGQNFGAGKYIRVKKGYLSAVGAMFIWGTLTGLALIFFGGPIFRIFITDSSIYDAGVSYLKIIGYSQMFMCIEITTVGALSGLGKTGISSVISIVLTSARIPLAYILSATALGLDGVWYALTISSIAKGITFFIIFMYISSQLLQENKL